MGFSITAQRCLIVLSLIGALLAGLPADAAQKDQSVDVLWVKQQNAYLGASDLYLGDERGRVVTRNGNIVIICAPPHWDVLIFNKKDKLGLCLSSDEWQKSGLKAVESRVKLSTAKRSPTFDTALHLDCWESIVPANVMVFTENDPLVFRGGREQKLSEIQFRCTRGMRFSPHMTQFIIGLFNTKGITDLPLSLFNQWSDGTRSPLYKTLSVKKTKLPLSSFDYPTGYKKSKNIPQTLLGSTDMKTVTDFMNAIIDEDQQGKGK